LATSDKKLPQEVAVRPGGGGAMDIDRHGGIRFVARARTMTMTMTLVMVMMMVVVTMMMMMVEDV
jgi:hypothetical protein